MGGLGSLIGAIDELVAEDPSALADPDTVVELHRQLARLEAVATKAVGRFDAEQRWAPDGARGAAAWLARRCSLPRPSADRRVRLARHLRHMPAVDEAWCAGNLDSAHVSVLAQARAASPARAAELEAFEDRLVGFAKSLSFAQFCRAVRYWTHAVDPDGADAEEADKVTDRRFHLSQTFRDMWVGDFLLDPINGAIVAEEIRRIEEELFAADWGEAKERLGRDPLVHELRRSAAQRRADALVEMAVRSRTAPADGRRPEPLFTVLVGYETFHGRICELANGTVISPGALVPYLDAAWAERVVFGSPSRVIDVGVHRRLFEGATRRAVEIRDRECFHPFCEDRFEHCQVDHVEPYGAGGITVQTNGRVACGFHNRRRHQANKPRAPDP